jgi:RimJ/RimL family protein N-acetyltransferase
VSEVSLPLPVPAPVRPFSVRSAEIGDALATLALHRDVVAEDRWLVPHPDEAPLTLELRQREIELSVFLVAHGGDGRIIGLVSIVGGRYERSRHLGELQLLVAAPHRRTGIGRALLDEALIRARATGVLRKVSAAVFADNAPAISLLRSMGFVDEGRRIGQYRERDGRLRGDLLLAKFV